MDAKDIAALLFGVFMTLLGWLGNRAIGRLDSDMQSHNERLNEHDKLHNNCSTELLHFKAEVANTYAKESNMQSSLARIHDRIDKLPGEIVDLIKRVK